MGMEPLRIPSEAEIRAAYREGEDAVLKLFHDTFSQLAERIQRLEDQIAKDSRLFSFRRRRRSFLLHP
jgi:hypothetical protein